MPRTELTVQNIGRVTPLEDPTLNVPDNVNGNRFDNTTQRVFLYVTNGALTNVTLTVIHPGVSDTNLAVADRTYTITAGERWVIGPFPSVYNQTLDGDTQQVALDWSASALITVQVLMLPPA